MKKQPVPNNLLRQARIARGWTQSDVAEQVGAADSQTVHSWEKGKRFPSRIFRQRLCKIFEKSPQELGLLPIEAERPAAAPALALVRIAPFSPAVTSSTDPETETTITMGGGRRSLFHQGTDVNRQRMLNRVRSTWIEGVFQESLHQAILIALGLQELPEALANPWRFEVQETNLPNRVLPPGTKIIQVYDEAQGELLILGEPGAGKTTLLLELTGYLLARAEDNISYPLPVVFNLSSWATKSLPLEEWLVEELHTKYRVPRRVGHEWLYTDQLTLLLDGLDEMRESNRSACVKAIDEYQKAHPLVSVVICCRKADYFALETHVSLQRAVLIQELTTEQIHQYLSIAGEQLTLMKQELDADPDLLEMVKTPLMLSIVALVYQGKPQRALVLSGSLDARRKQILEVYVQHMLTRRGTDPRYRPREVVHWLSWLANTMQRRGLTELYLERIQPDWLPDDHTRQRYRGTVLRLVYGFQAVVAAALYAWVRGGKVSSGTGVGAGLLGQFGGGPGNTALGWMAPGFGGGVEGGGALGVLIALVYTILIIVIGAASFPNVSWRSAWYGLKQGLLNGIKTCAVIGLAGVLMFGLIGGIGHGLVYGIGAGTFAGLLTGLLSGLQAGLFSRREAGMQPPQRRPFAQRLVDGLAIGLAAGISFGIVDASLHIWVQSMLVYGSIIGLFYCAIFGLGPGSELIPDLGKEIKPAESVSWSWANVGESFRGNLIRGLLIGLAIMLWVGLVIGGASGLFYGVGYGVRYGLIYGLVIGLIAITAILLAGILNSGWSSDVLDTQQLFRPNEGIRRSLLNATVAAVLFSIVGGLISGTVCGIAFGEIGKLQSWFVLGAGFTIIFGLLFGVQFFIIHGGIAWVEHYMLRWYFERAGHMPWNCIRFLNYAAERILLRKVGGGYMFSHRLLLDYFSGLGGPGEGGPQAPSPGS